MQKLTSRHPRPAFDSLESRRLFSTTLTLSHPTPAESDKFATFELTVSTPRATSLTLHYSTRPVTATPGKDYTPRTGSLTLPASATTAKIKIPLLNDNRIEANECFRLLISSLPPGVKLAKSFATATIRDDDAAPTPTLTVAHNNVFSSSDNSLVRTGAGPLTLANGNSAAWTNPQVTVAPPLYSTVNVVSVDSLSQRETQFVSAAGTLDISAGGTYTGSAAGIYTGSAAGTLNVTATNTLNLTSLTLASSPPTELHAVTRQMPTDITGYGTVINSGAGTLAFTGGSVSTNLINFGDLNLNGQVNGDDYALLDRGYAHHLSGGDFNYDGSTTASGFLLTDTATTPHANLSPDFLAQRESQFGDAYVAQLVAATQTPDAPAAST